MAKDYRTTEYDPQRFMLVSMTALVPCFMMGVYVFGLDMLDNMLGGCGLAVILAWLTGMTGASGDKKPDREPEYLAAVITGALIVYGLPSTMPIWMVFVGVALAMIPGSMIVKWVQKKAGNDSGGVFCILERAVITSVFGQVAIWALFREEMNTWPLNDFVETRVSPGDVATGMTPLEILADSGDLPGLSRMFVGFISGPCGEVSVAAALIGGVYLVWKKIISPLMPVVVLAVMFAAAFVYYMTAVPSDELIELAGTDAAGVGAAFYLACYHLMAGGAVFGAFFLSPAICLRGAVPRPIKISESSEASYQKPHAEDREKALQDALQKKTADRIVWVQIVSAVGVGIITMVLRIKGIYAEGMALPVLVMFILVRTAMLLMQKKTKKPSGIKTE